MGLGGAGEVELGGPVPKAGGTDPERRGEKSELVFWMFSGLQVYCLQFLQGPTGKY